MAPYVNWSAISPTTVSRFAGARRSTAPDTIGGEMSMAPNGDRRRISFEADQSDDDREDEHLQVGGLDHQCCSESATDSRVVGAIRLQASAR
jgi:hypothetical protein